MPFSHHRNAEKILEYLHSNVLSYDLIPPHVNFSHLSTSDYAEMYGVIRTVKEHSFAQLGLEPCVLENELNKVSLWLRSPSGDHNMLLYPTLTGLTLDSRRSRAPAWLSSPSLRP